MTAVKITADSTCDLSPELIARCGVDIAPLYIDMDGKSLRDGVEVQAEQVCQYFEKTGRLAKTSAVPVGDYLEFFGKYTRQGVQVVHFTISAQMSSCYQNACMAAQELGGGVWVVDSRNLSTGIALLILKACELRDQGQDAQEIFDRVSALAPCAQVTFVIDTLEYLAKGGRCSALLALGANLLKLKPCIQVRQGEMVVGKKYRGAMAKVLPQYVADQLGGGQQLDLSRVFITHTGCSAQVVEQVRQRVLACAPFEEVIETVAGSTITSHCGRNTLGILYMTKP